MSTPPLRETDAARTGPVTVDSASSISAGTVQACSETANCSSLTAGREVVGRGLHLRGEGGMLCDCLGLSWTEATTDLCIAGSCVFAVGETTCVADGECAGINSCTTGLCASGCVFHRADRAEDAVNRRVIVPFLGTFHRCDLRRLPVRGGSAGGLPGIADLYLRWRLRGVDRGKQWSGSLLAVEFLSESGRGFSPVFRTSRGAQLRCGDCSRKRSKSPSFRFSGQCDSL